jgi:hypothetical protein
MPTPILTSDELVSTLRKSSLPTVLVEGTSDVRIYRRIEEMLGQNIGDVLFCGCRNNLLEVFKRRNEVANITIVFLADQDMWLFQNIPAELSEIVWTSGYSIENDAYSGSDVEKLLETAERPLFGKLLDEVCEWFAFEVEEFRRGHPPFVAQGIGRVLNDERNGVRKEFLSERKFVKPNVEVVTQIRQNYALQLRGKTLLDLLAQIIHASKRKEKYNNDALLWICVCMNRNPDHLVKLVDTLKKKLNPQEVLPIA